MTRKKLYLMSDEELKALSSKKDKKGCATSDAYSAQEILSERSLHWPGVSSTVTQEQILAQETGGDIYDT